MGSEKSDNQRIAVIIDALRDDSLRAIGGVLREFSLKSGDTLTAIAVLHEVNNPMGYRVSVDSGSMLGTNEKIIEEALAIKEKYFHYKKDIINISEQCEEKEIGFHLMVVAGKMEAVEQARNSQPKWVILDKEMKRAKKVFLEGVSCGVSTMKRDNSFQVLRCPNVTPQPLDDIDEEDVKYDEMIPGSPKQRKNKHAKTSKYHHSKRKPALTDSQRGEIRSERSALCSKCKNMRPRPGWTRDFSYSELMEATKGFSDSNFISEGGFGAVFRGELRDGTKIAVKHHKIESEQGEREFRAEVYHLSTAIHENVVMLLGSCSDGARRLLVYEYVCNGSLDMHHSRHARRPLSWEQRMKVATGAANGLLYLHQNNIVHRDIRPNNILLTHDYKALLGDFGLARTQQDEHSAETSVVGTLGYLAPEYAESGKVSTKTDVYAFGIILLQLITGRATNDKILGDKSLVGWARPLLKDKNYPDLIDPRITDSHDFHQLFWMVRVAANCLSKDPRKRLTMNTVAYALNRLSSEADSICQIMLSPEHSDSSPRSSLDSPIDKYDVVHENDNDNVQNYYDQASGDKLGPYINKEPQIKSDNCGELLSTGSLSKSSSSRSISSERSSVSTGSELFSLDNGLY